MLPQDAPKQDLNKRLETVSWGLFLIMLGGFALAEGRPRGDLADRRRPDHARAQRRATPARHSGELVHDHPRARSPCSRGSAASSASTSRSAPCSSSSSASPSWCAPSSRAGREAADAGLVPSGGATSGLHPGPIDDTGRDHRVVSAGGPPGLVSRACRCARRSSRPLRVFRHEPAASDGADETSGSVEVPTVGLTLYTGDSVAFGYVPLSAARVTDLMNEHEEFAFVDTYLESLEDGHELAAGSVRGRPRRDLRRRRGRTARRSEAADANPPHPDRDAGRALLRVGESPRGSRNRPPHELPEPAHDGAGDGGDGRMGFTGRPEAGAVADRRRQPDAGRLDCPRTTGCAAA